MAALYHAVRGHKGFVVLTGEVGTGKTLLLRCVLELFRESSDITYAYVFNGLLSPCEFLEYIANDFGLSVSGKNKSQILSDLSKYLVARGSQDLTTVLVVDEAHHLSAEILEEIRLLTNLETTRGKLLQILLSASRSWITSSIRQRCGSLSKESLTGRSSRRWTLPKLRATLSGACRSREQKMVAHCFLRKP